MPGFEKATIHVNRDPLGLPPAPVDARVYGDWAFHRSLIDSCWTVTHVPTGLRIADAPNGRAARMLVAAANRLTKRYGLSTRQEIEEHPAMRSLFRDYDGLYDRARRVLGKRSGA